MLGLVVGADSRDSRECYIVSQSYCTDYTGSDLGGGAIRSLRVYIASSKFERFVKLGSEGTKEVVKGFVMTLGTCLARPLQRRSTSNILVKDKRLCVRPYKKQLTLLSHLNEDQSI